MKKLCNWFASARFVMAAFVLMVVSCGSGEKGQNTPEPEPEPQEEPELLRGGDISELSLVEREGGKYYLDGQEMDCVKLLAECGFNIARLRLYNDPGNASFSPSCRLPKGIQDEADVLALAKRAKAEGLQIELTFHYSDYWTNGGQQIKPHAWADLDFAVLKDSVYSFTRDFLTRMVGQGTSPEFVSLGNETQAGMLYPDGKVANMSNLCDLYNSGARAVREVCPDAKIIIHSDDGGNLDKYNWLYGELRVVDYDVIGASYYPYWTGRNVAQIIEFAKSISASIGKQIMIMETGYAWNPVAHDGWPGQIEHNRPYTEMTKAGQKAFMQELFDSIQNNPKANIIGVLYWDPIFIPAGNAGWETGGRNVVSNTTLFDFEGNALPALQCFDLSR